MSEDHYDDEHEGGSGGGARHPMAQRFRGYLPVVVDVETGGFNCATDALLEAATSGSSKFFLGTDSAPHALHAKEAACGCAGCYTAYAAIELYAEAFEQRNALDKLEGFASLHGPDFYGLPRNTDRITLVREDWTAPTCLPLGEHTVIPLRAGEQLRWRLLEHTA